MYRKSYSLFLICFLLILTSCASGYNYIYPKHVNYSTRMDYSGIQFSYKYDVLKESGNKKYAKKEVKKDLQLVAVRITNRTDSTIIFSENISLYAGGRLLKPLNPSKIKKQLKQPSLIYLLYSPLWFNYSVCTEFECDVTSIPIGLPISAGNIFRSASANKDFLKELKKYDILDKPINPGETVYGIIGIKDTGYNPLTIQVRN